MGVCGCVGECVCGVRGFWGRTIEGEGFSQFSCYTEYVGRVVLQLSKVCMQ